MSIGDEQYLLALLDTTPTIDGTVHDRLAADEDARRWLDQHLDDPSPAADLAALRRARSTLQRVARGETDPVDLAEVLDGVGSRPTATSEGLAWTLDVPAPCSPAVRAVLAWDEVRRRWPGRLRPCANPECSLFLIDRSKNGAGRWCSMASCGNRLKARRHHDRRRSAGTDR